MHDFILNIDNKEILIEILHHAVDHLIESPRNKPLTANKFSHKFGFANPDEFERAIKFIASVYRSFALQLTTDIELIVHFAHLNADLQQSVLDVIRTRLPAVQEFLLNEYNGRETALLQSFDWDVKLVMGSSSLAALRQRLVTLVLQCRAVGGGGDKRVFVEMDRAKVRRMIATLDECARKMDEQAAGRVTTVDAVL